MNKKTTAKKTPYKRGKSAVTGHPVKPEVVKANPRETVVETIGPDKVRVFIKNLMEVGIDEQTLGGIERALVETTNKKRFPHRATLLKAVKKQISLARG